MNNWGKDKREELKKNYLDKLSQIDQKQLYEETKNKIWLSAYANNNPRSDYHWQCDACYDEWKNRDDLESYSRAWESVAKQ